VRGAAAFAPQKMGEPARHVPRRPAGDLAQQFRVQRRQAVSRDHAARDCVQHVGGDTRTKLVHTVLATAATVADREALPYLLHGKETRVRAKIEHVFGVIKNIFGFRKTRYRGLAKNLHQLEVTTALANLYIVRRRLLNA
jgi:IS5 family transposase